MTRNHKKKLAAATSSSSFDSAIETQNFQPVVGLRASIQPAASIQSKIDESQRVLEVSSSKAPVPAMASAIGSQPPVASTDKSKTKLPSDSSTITTNSEPQIEQFRSSNKKVRERINSLNEQQAAAEKSMDEQRVDAVNPLETARPTDLGSVSSPVTVSNGLEAGKLSATKPMSDTTKFHDLIPASTNLEDGLSVLNTKAGSVCSYGLDRSLETDKQPCNPTVVNMQVNEATGVSLAASGALLTDCSREIASPVVNMQVDGHIYGAQVTECSRLNALEYPTVQNSIFGKGVPLHDSNNSANTSKSPWLDVVKNNRKVEFMGPLFEITEGVTNVGVDLVESDVVLEDELEARCLIGMFNGKFPGIDMVQKMVDNWPKRCKFNFNRTGWFVFKFDDASDMQFVLRSASFYAANKPMVVKQMPRHFHFSKEEFSLVPTWVQFPNLPLSCWKSEALGKICTFIGVPLFVDKITKDQENISFARCLIEVDAIEQLPESMILTMPNGKKNNAKYSIRRPSQMVPEMQTVGAYV